MKEIMKCVGHQQTSQLLHNKFIVVLGDSIQRSVYKDLVLLLQKDKYLSLKQLKSKGEMSFEQDCLVEGGCLSEMHNGTEYREVRQFQSAHHLVRFYFVTRIYSHYMRSILDEFRHGLKPDVVVVNSCVWDISRYNATWLDNYKKNLHTFFGELSGILPEETLIVWNLTMPLGERINGGFLVPEIEHKVSHLRYDVIEANFYSGTLADTYGMDALDLHFQFRFSLQHRTKDGVHWNAIAHRKITSLLLQHSAQAWGVIMPLTTVEHTEVTPQKPAHGNATKPAGRHPSRGNYYNGYRGEFCGAYIPFGYMNPPPPPPPPCYRHVHVRSGFHHRPPHHFEPYNEPHHHHHPFVMRPRHARHHYAPYTHHRPSQYGHRGRYY
ncbi:PC-esterase domain-containing protein 1A-like isoform X2 [Cottoperca gobio]|uniref:PC-esterase domain-containing protein 1A-like isoform X2 n=1 Tax=Cottoperca gobio TaxID=56716 RepID=A0A6J2RNL4_COTGO|nr:PC-esterase domain-containing protein 1A-like isoform X2 [Cottoperca gobio]